MIKLNNSILNTKPLNKIPKGLIYKSPNSKVYYLTNTKTGECVGQMCAFAKDCTKSSFYDVEPNGTTFHIYSFEIYEEHKRKGWGTYFANFAKNESFNQGCKGRTSLVAFNPDKSPHVFWWKQGFITKEPETNRLLKHYNEKHISPSYMFAKDMFLPIPQFMKKPKPKPEPPKTFWGKVVNFFREL